MHILQRADSNNTLSAYIVQPSGQFDEQDGNWSTFNLDVGYPPQSFRMIPSSSSFQTWLPSPASCNNGSYNAATGLGGYSFFPANCPGSRGVGQFRGSQSTGYQGNLSSSANPNSPGSFAFTLGALVDGGGSPANWFGKGNTSFDGSGALWQDYMQLSSPAADNLNLTGRTPILQYDTRFYLLPTVGIAPGVSENRVDGGSINSTLQILRQARKIPSASWGYTAGSYNASQQRLGSLTLGGLDLSRIDGTQAKFNMRPTYELEVPVSSINLSYNNGSSAARVPGAAFPALIDSTLPYLFLPNDILQSLAGLLKIRYQNATGIWFFSPTTSDLANSSSVSALTITLAANGTGTDVAPLVISIPLNTLIVPPTRWIYNIAQANLYILPIRNATSTGAVLGRAFLQEAYVFADYERKYFNVSRTIQGTPGNSVIVSVDPLSNNFDPTPSNDNGTITSSPTPTAQPTGLSTGAIAGIAVGSALGALLILALLGALLWFCVFKKRRDRKKQDEKATLEAQRVANEAAAAEAKEKDVGHSRYSMTSDGSTMIGIHQRRESGHSELSAEGNAVAQWQNKMEQIHEVDNYGERPTPTELPVNQQYPPVEMEAHPSPGTRSEPSPLVSTFRSST